MGWVSERSPNARGQLAYWILPKVNPDGFITAAFNSGFTAVRGLADDYAIYLYDLRSSRPPIV